MAKRSSVDIGRDLREWLEAKSMTEEALSLAISIDNPGIFVSQSWISRICCGEFKRLSGKTGIVLSYANIRIEDELPLNERGKEIIDAAVSDIWDGSIAGAKALARVLHSAAALAQGAGRA
ncbi:hypothetical protein [Sphingopyxis terrae]|uniref:hypothetical protein n=1 Tax=Sphingopyxis terrae TaxID=33052 RepID=UPI00105484EB|nr:hypothetical protein [Sphingopyxis terrae]